MLYNFVTTWLLSLNETVSFIFIIDNKWVEKFKFLLSENKCELIGSGWSQLIGPLVPYEVNVWNHKIALEYYRKILNVRPNIVLVNEMAFSTSLVDIYREIGYDDFHILYLKERHSHIL